MSQALELRVRSALGRHAFITIDVGEIAGEPTVSRLTAVECGLVEDLESEGPGDGASASGHGLTHEHGAVCAHEMPKAVEPQQPIGFPCLTLTAFALDDRP
jgi:hypothetical protein